MNVGSPRFIMCGKCKAKYDVSGFKPGKKFKCQGCGETLAVPATAAAPATQSRDSGTRLAQRRPVGVRPGSQVRAVAAPQTEAGPPMGRAARMASVQPSNAPIIISAVAVVVIIVVLIIFLKSGNKEPAPADNQQTASTQTTTTPSSTNPSATGQNSSGTGASTTTQPTTSEPGTQPGTGNPPGTGTTTQPDNPGGGEPPSTEPGQTPQPVDPKKPPAKRRGEFIVDATIQGDINNMLQEMPYASQERTEECAKTIEAFGDRAVPILIEALKNEDTMIGNAASNLLRSITGNEYLELKAGIDPEAVEYIYKEWKEWWIVHQFTYKRRKEEKIQKMSREKFRAEVLKQLDVMKLGNFTERSTAKRKLRAMGKEIIPVFIETLAGDDPDLANLVLVQLKEITGEDFGPVPETEREAFKKKWEDWWDENRDAFKMPE